jgi:hypothetical protein
VWLCVFRLFRRYLVGILTFSRVYTIYLYNLLRPKFQTHLVCFVFVITKKIDIDAIHRPDVLVTSFGHKFLVTRFEKGITPSVINVFIGFLP